MSNEGEHNEIPMIPKYQAEAMLMHMGRANKHMLIAIISVCIAMVAMVIIFVSGYTSRTKDWLNTLTKMQGGSAVTEVTDGIHEQQNP